jgi:Tol biopolymer transport system component
MKKQRSIVMTIFALSEWMAVFFPDGSKIVYIGGRNRAQAGIDSRSSNMFTLNLGSLDVTQITPMGAFVDPGNPAWFPDREFLAFTAQGTRRGARPLLVTV